MNEKGKKFNFKFLEKLKNVKHIEIYIAILFVVVILLIYFSTVNNKTETKQNSNTTTNELSITTYIEDLRKNLEDILSNIGGVTDAKVLITLDTNQLEVVDSKIVVQQFPQIKGVIVTAKGVENIATKMKVLSAIEAVVDVTNGNIEILSSN